jgi:dihydroorotate dehydrogenase electron transfer subunit
MPKQCMASVIDNTRISDNICLLRIKTNEISSKASAGQFIHIKCGDNSLLRRPISICDVKEGAVTLAVEIRGDGTRWLCARQAGDMLDIVGPLGRGFDLSGKNIILVGGGIGVPPMLFAARSCAGRAAAVLGFRGADCVILKKEFQAICQDVLISTDDGSMGAHGPVTLPLKKLLSAGGYDGVLACGPRAMLQAVAELSAAYAVPCQVSMEERMGCGIGACLVCACKTQKNGKEEMRHVCKDGPVFLASEVVW